MSIANDMHEAFFAQCRADDALEKALDDAGIPFEDYTTDYYDNSIELYTSVPATPPWLAALFAAGFSLVFWHPNYRNGKRGSSDDECTSYRNSIV